MHFGLYLACPHPSRTPGRAVLAGPPGGEPPQRSAGDDGTARQSWSCQAVPEPRARRRTREAAQLRRLPGPCSASRSEVRHSFTGFVRPPQPAAHALGASPYLPATVATTNGSRGSGLSDAGHSPHGVSIEAIAARVYRDQIRPVIARAAFVRAYLPVRRWRGLAYGSGSGVPGSTR